MESIHAELRARYAEKIYREAKYHAEADSGGMYDADKFRYEPKEVYIESMNYVNYYYDEVCVIANNSDVRVALRIINELI